MLFIFPTIVSTFIYYILEINGFNVNSKNEAINEINSSFNGNGIIVINVFFIHIIGNCCFKHFYYI